MKVDIQIFFLNKKTKEGNYKSLAGNFKTEKFQNNAMNDVKQISLSHVITNKIATF